MDKLFISLGIGGVLGCIAIVLAAIAGWIGNVVQLVYMAQAETPIGALFIIKCVGCLVAPLGSIMGWVGFF